MKPIPITLLLLPATLVCSIGATQEDAGLDGGVEEDGDAGVFDDNLFDDFPVEEADPIYESVIRSRRPISKDDTRDDLVVDGEQLRNSSRPSTLEALSQKSAGIYVTGRGAIHGVASGASGGIHIRGLGGSPNSQILVIEDGAPDLMGIFGHPIPDAYVPFLLEDALVIKGGDSVLYGTNAMGGVVVLRNRWLDEDGFELVNDASYGSFSTIRESAALLLHQGKWDLATAFLAMSTEGHRTWAGGNELVGQLASRYRFTENVSLSIRNKVLHLKGSDPGPVTHPNDDHWFDVWRNNTSANLTFSPDHLKLSVVPFANVGVHELYDGFRSVDYVTGGDAVLEIEAHRMLSLLAGLAARHVDGKVTNRISDERSPVKSISDLSGYGQVTFTPLDPLSIVAGARALYSFTYDLVFLYKAGISWDMFRGLYMRTGLARNFRQPTIRELHLPYPTANPDLRPEYALNWDLTLGYDSRHLEISATGYRTEATDMIRYFGAWPSAEVVNIDHIVFWGVEGRIALEEMGPAFASVTADWKDVGRYTQQNPEAKLNFTAGAKKRFERNTISGELGGEWVHGLYMSNYEREPMDDVFFLDISLRYRRELKGGAFVEPYVFLKNILDSRYAYVEGYPMPGFNITAGMRLGI